MPSGSWPSSQITGDLLGVNEWHERQYWSLMQLTALLRSYEVSAGRRGCCNYVLYCRPALLNCGAKAAYDLAGPGLLRQPGAKDLKDSADLNYAGAQSGHATLRACQISRGEESKFQPRRERGPKWHRRAIQYAASA
jgi:hypothetical protein